jgi:ankyrin repeat protein
MKASSYGYIEIVNELLNKNANSKNQYGSTALIKASEYGYKRIIK